MCLPPTAHIITLWPRLSCLLCVCLSIPRLFCSLLANIYLLCVSGALCTGRSVYRVLYSVCLLCSTAVVLYSSTNNVFSSWSLPHSDLGWSVCLPTTLCCLLVCHCMFRAGRIDVNGGLEQVRRGCMVSAGRSVFWCPSVRAGSDSCGRNGRWKSLIFRHNRVHVQNQGAVLRKSSPRGVHPAHFSARQGENVRRPISSAHFTLDVYEFPVVLPNDQGAPCRVVYPFSFLFFLEETSQFVSLRRDSNSRPNVRRIRGPN